jgi:hypothetical protein
MNGNWTRYKMNRFMELLETASLNIEARACRGKIAKSTMHRMISDMENIWKSGIVFNPLNRIVTTRKMSR